MGRTARGIQNSALTTKGNLTDYEGTLIEESLRDTAVLQSVTVTATRVEPVTAAHKTPGLKHWTLHTVIIPAGKADVVAGKLSKALAGNYWYADFKDLLQNKPRAQSVMIFVPNRSKPTKRNRSYGAKALARFGVKRTRSGLRIYFARGLKNNTTHYIIFPGKIFKIDRTEAAGYQATTAYGLTLGIPDYQLDFAPNVIQRERPAA